MQFKEKFLRFIRFEIQIDLKFIKILTEGGSSLMYVEDTSCSFPLLSRRSKQSFSLLTIVNISPLSQVNLGPGKMIRMSSKEKLVYGTHKSNQRFVIYQILALKDPVYLCI